MKPSAFELTEDHFNRIGDYVLSHLHGWILEDREMNGDAVSGQIGRLESGLEAVITLTRERFEAMDRRFEAMDKRFEVLEKGIESRFEAMDKRFDEQAAFTRERFAAVDRRFEEQARIAETRFEFLAKRMNRQFSVQVAMWTSVFAAAAASVLPKILA